MIAPANNRFKSSSDRPSRQQAWDIAHQSLAEEGLLSDQPPSVGNHINKTIGRYPLLAIATATAIGIATGWWIKRRDVQ
ncbi:hypothetical protein EC9_28180 [Rosistilla ulvae]|uniref:Uncharacterized protein n=1 Tax=Rosistilla ulvae TaxID=1930277 RepID=A0A517M179_9BACT|nr:hypothetical protein [Rosistilla ulvae]QDS88627.1 hypothetical protein EC9_28180 [Rosistilla ulvae]